MISYNLLPSEDLEDKLKLFTKDRQFRDILKMVFCEKFNKNF